ncbi:MAG TPA: energy transducer TonB [Bryobacteraceae bacterium]|nr:energy transducer TonB [Bryobacteraceae bacterium]
METAVTPPPEAELHLLTDWTEPGRNKRIGRSAVLSLVTHAAAIAFVIWMPETFMQPPNAAPKESVVTPLVLPPISLTQREPNPRKIIREFRSPDLTPRIQSPHGPSPTPQSAAPHKDKPSMPPPPPKTAPQTPLPEPPRVQIAETEPKLTLPLPPAAPPNAPSPFEDLGPRNSAGQGTLPGQSVDSLRGTMSGHGGINSQGSAPFASSGAELPRLLSDPKGVDFKPYLAQVLASVKRAWYIILPKNGHRGYVSLQFAIRRDGTVRKVAYAQQTGDPTLDETAVMAISQAGPFGPLPGQFPDSEIHVQMNFAYNQPRQ